MRTSFRSHIRKTDMSIMEFFYKNTIRYSKTSVNIGTKFIKNIRFFFSYIDEIFLNKFGNLNNNINLI